MPKKRKRRENDMHQTKGKKRKKPYEPDSKIVSDIQKADDRYRPDRRIIFKIQEGIKKRENSKTGSRKEK